MHLKKNAFSITELIVVIVILLILSSLWFIHLAEYFWNAKKSKIIYDIKSLTSNTEIKLSKWFDIKDLIIKNENNTNKVYGLVTIGSGKYILDELKYEVGSFDFSKLKINKNDFLYEDSWKLREYIFGYAKTSKKVYYEFAWQVFDSTWKYDVFVSGSYKKLSSTDTKGLISENWYSSWLKNWMTLTGSLY